jgi:hypothetical protein
MKAVSLAEAEELARELVNEEKRKAQLEVGGIKTMLGDLDVPLIDGLIVVYLFMIIIPFPRLYWLAVSFSSPAFLGLPPSVFHF